MPKVNKTRYAILGILNALPCSGYDIKKYSDQSISHFWNENFGHIYPVLKQLETEGMITKKVEQNEGKPSRNVYFITQKGKDEFTTWLMQPVDYTPVRSELLLKLSFARNLPAHNILEKLEYDKQLNLKRLEKFEEIEKSVANDEEGRTSESYTYLLASLRFGIYSAKSRVKWCEETIECIKANRTRQE